MVKKSKQKAAGYCRVSTKEQINKISLPDQQKQIKNYCINCNFNLIKIYVEKGFSGSTEDRPEFRKMLIGAAQRDFSVLVVTDSDRFGRSVEDRLSIRKMFTRELGIELHSIADGVFKDSATGKFQDTIKAGVSEYYRDLQIEKSASALAYKLSDKGERNIGRIFYGLAWADDKKDAIHHPEEYPNVRKVVELRINKRWSYAIIANHLNKKKIPYRGKPWNGHQISYICSQNAKIYSQGYSFITYKGKKYKYTFPPLISKSELHQLKNITPSYLVNGRPRKRYLLSGKIVCGLCGTNVQHHIIKGKCGGKKKAYQYYTCRNKLEPANGEQRCQMPSIPQEWLEWWVWQHLTGLFKDQKHFEQVLFRANAKLKKDNMQAEDIAVKIMEIGEALNDIAAQIENIIDFIATGGISKGAAKKKLAKLEMQEAKLRKERQELESEQSLLLRTVATIEKINETRLWWLEYAEKLDESNKRELIDAFIERIKVWPRNYSKEQAQRDDKYGGGAEGGLSRPARGKHSAGPGSQALFQIVNFQVMAEKKITKKQMEKVLNK